MAFDESPAVASARVDRVFGSAQYFRLWIAQILSSGGDWLALFAHPHHRRPRGRRDAGGFGGLCDDCPLSAWTHFRHGGWSAGGPLDRKRTMVVCDLGRAATLLWLPFVDFVWQLVLASLILEGFALLWAPAKESSVPNLVAPGEADRGQLPVASRRLRHVSAGRGRVHRSGRIGRRDRTIHCGQLLAY